MDVKKEIRELLAGILDLDVDSISDDASPGAPEKWDSLKHMQFLIAMEEELEMSFSDEEMAALIDLPSVVAIVEQKISSGEL